MKFQHTKYPEATLKTKTDDGVKSIRFRGGYAETTDKDLVKALKANEDVEQVKEEAKRQGDDKGDQQDDS